jgi:hypothetical protein
VTARAACAKLAEVIEESHQLVEQSWRLVLSAYPRLHPIRGGSDAAMIATVLSGVPLCQACLEKKTDVPSDRVDAVLAAIGTTLKLDVGPGRCHVCLEERPTTYRLATTAGGAQET